MTSIDKQALARPARGLLRFSLRRHHHLEAECDELVRTALHEDPHVLASRWRAIEDELREHMAAEEDLILPAFQLSDPEEAVELRSEHARIREVLDEIGRHVFNGGIHTERLRRLAVMLRAHAVREDASIYPWAERHLPLVEWRQLRHRIRGWLQRDHHE